MADDLGWNDVGFHGSEIDTPNIDRLAREGVALDRFYTAPVCSPTRAALLTGRSPVQLGIWYDVIRVWDRFGLAGPEYTLAERFRDAGYQTAIVGKWHLGHARSEYLPNLQGFDFFFGTLGGTVDYYGHGRGSFEHDLQENGTSVRRTGYLTTLLADEAVRRIADRDRRRPFFLYLPHQAPHAPNQAPEATVERYAHLAPESRRLHAAMVSELDGAVGRVLDALDAECLAEETLVVFTSDNGGVPEFGGDNFPLRGGKATIFEGGIRVPAVIRWPGVLPAGAVSEQRMRDYDLFPTLEAAAGLFPLRAPPESMNVWPVLQGAPLRDRTFFFARGLFQSAVIDGRWKLTERGFLAVERSLFELDTDPSEARDLAAEHPAVVDRLVELLAANRARHPADGTGLATRPPDWLPREDLTDYLEDPEVLAAHLERQSEPRRAPGLERRPLCRPGPKAARGHRDG